MVIFIAFFLIILGGMYGIARWYIASQSNQPLTLGVTFVPDYAESLGLNPEATMQALITDMHVKQFRLTSYWSDLEPSPGHYDFSQLDWQFQKAQAAHAKVMLSIGLRQPRWPECHLPSWAANEPASVWEPQLDSFITAVVNRYKDSPSLQSYQLENEYFLKGFGDCTNFSRSRLVSEYNLVRKLDPSHPIILARSNNAIGIPVGQPKPSEFGISIYKRVWDTHSHRYFEYPIPAWYYAFLAGLQKIILGKNMIVDELQAEPWPPHGKTIPQATLSEQNKTMTASILKTRIQYGEATGMKTIYLWGAEYWYYRKVILHDPSVWNVAVHAFNTADNKN
ncbi:MAG TPA: beta-galactosidase [Candidatus Saccharimonadales bacterium]|nr:beta-galactosidase [Candidatus Saccharimonadales bacterium]